MKKIPFLCSLIFLCSDIQGEEFSHRTWIKEWEIDQNFQSENVSLNTIKEVEKIDPTSTRLQKLYNSLGDEYISLNKLSEANECYLKAINHSDRVTDDTVYAYTQIKNYELNIDTELELLILHDIGDYLVISNNSLTARDMITVKLSDREIQDRKGAFQEFKKHNLLDSKEDIAYVKGFSLFRKKKQSLKKKKQSLKHKVRKIRRKLPRKSRD